MLSRARSSLLLWFVTLMVAALTICRADSKVDENSLVQQTQSNVTPVRHTDWRKVLHAEFEYAPADKTTQRESAEVTEVSPESPADPDTVALPKFVVNEAAPNFREFEQVTQVPRKEVSEKVMKKLGTGVYEFKGRHFTFSAATIFFIPVAVGISW